MSKNISRRNFLKMATLGATAAAAAACSPGKTAGEAAAASRKQLGDMTYRQGPRGDKVSLLGYGCMRWPMIDNEKGEKVIDQETVNSLVDYAIDHGVNYFDTAPVYLQGQSEAATGIALKRYPRDKYYIATKLSNHRGDQSYAAGVQMYRNSLKNLQVEWIDYYLLHNISSSFAFEKRFLENGLLEFILGERKAGRIRNLGFSIHCARKDFDYLMEQHEKYHWDFVQIQMNYVDWLSDAEYFYTELEKRGIPVVIMEPLLGGQLSKLNGRATKLMKERSPEESVASWAFRFCGSKPGVMTTLSGMTYMEHLKDNVRTFCPLVPLSEEEFAMLDDIAQEFVKFPLVPCTDCKYCMPCPYGVDIPGVFRHYNKCLNEGLVKDDVGDPQYRAARRAFLVSLDRNVETLRQADHCINCRQCLPKCPQHITIPFYLHKIDNFVEDLKRNSKY